LGDTPVGWTCAAADSVKTRRLSFPRMNQRPTERTSPGSSEDMSFRTAAKAYYRAGCAKRM
jgi:hypothetical protein